MRILGTIIGLAIVAGGGFLVYGIWFSSGSSSPTGKDPLLTGAYEPRLAECRILEDAELPRGIEAPAVGSDVLYLQVVVLYPGASSNLNKDAYRLSRINAASGAPRPPLHSSTEYVEEEGTFLELIFKIDEEFETARLTLDDKVVIDSVEIQ